MTPKKALAASSQPGETPLSFVETLSHFLKNLPPRSRAIIEARFGVTNGSPKTLEEIGRSYRITRERVRQIVGSALGYLAQERHHPLVVAITERIQSTLAAKSGIMEAEALLKELSGGRDEERGAALTFLESLSAIRDEKATEEREKVYRLKDFSLERWSEVKDAALAVLEQAGQALEAEDFYARYSRLKPGAVSSEEFFDSLAVARGIKSNVFGKWGFTSWSDIQPRGTREKAFLVLKTAGKPLHFREISAFIDQYGLQGKKRGSHPQTVHNELIKDERFVLVGRGVYALAEWGYTAGTVRDVVEQVLRQSGQPLSRDEILAAVLKVRQVKKSTVIINLNTFFVRVSKGVYDVKRR